MRDVGAISMRENLERESCRPRCLLLRNALCETLRAESALKFACILSGFPRRCFSLGTGDFWFLRLKAIFSGEKRLEGQNPQLPSSYRLPEPRGERLSLALLSDCRRDIF